ncbi:MAG TPA: Trm112 family protein [Acidimicrobiia bacterium]|jgi:uncharacterized protein YbaR (Trm112 family)
MSLVDPLLMSILVCPADGGDLTEDEEASRLVCTLCKRRYPVREGIPVMMIEEAELDAGE